MRVIGVDGCSRGWFMIGENDNNQLSYKLYDNIQLLWQDNHDLKLALIDIPIGLKETGPEERKCDKLARKKLAKRKYSIFPAPCRQALSACSWEEANRINKKVRGKGLSKQSWNIASKIDQVDSLIKAEPEINNIFREAHPEVVFWALNSKSEMSFNKKTAEGYQERLNLLNSYLPEFEILLESILDDYYRKDLARDDILDALALYLAAKLNFNDDWELKSIPAEPELDPEGIRMEIVYPAKIYKNT
ncbi:MAG: DUF429 domain-containing protein [Halarsenatibacteraceae bacterium]